MSLPENTQDNIKDVMRTALVGIKPADQVILKGYMRVLLRLEADLEWVSANHPEVDLFMINNEFRESDNVVRLIQANFQKPILYVGRTVSKEGNLEENLLTLPLKETNKLNDWLFANVSVLNAHIAERRNTSEKIIDNTIDDRRITDQRYQDFEESTQINETQIRINKEHKPVVNQFNPAKTRVVIKDTHNTDYQNLDEVSSLVELIKLLKMSEEGIYQLLSDDKLLAIVDLSKSQIWIEGDVNSLRVSDLNTLKLRSLQENPYTTFNLLNMKQALWKLALNHMNELSKMVNDEKKYQIAAWVKPTSKEGRRDLLRIMTAMEKSPVTIAEISEASEVDEEDVKKVIAGLLFAGCLQKSSYINISLRKTLQPPQKDKKVVQTLDNVISRRAAGEKPKLQTSSSIPIALIKKDSTSEVNASSEAENLSKKPVKKKPKSEKQGFLSRLRKKFGL